MPLRDRLRLPHLPRLDNPFDGAKPLTDGEVNKLRPIVREALVWMAENADDAISQTNRRHTRAEIWSGAYGLDDEDFDKLTEAMLNRARLNAAAAQVVRGVANIWQDFQILLILGPKFWSTLQFYRANGGFVLP